jgi:membrane protease YdiL (CAAX protease family)
LTCSFAVCYGQSMPLIAPHPKQRLMIVVLLTLLPWPAVWLGMYRLDSIVWTFVFYHGLCLLPAAIWGQKLWRGALRWPTARQWGALAAAVAVVLPLTLLVYAKIGRELLDAPDLLRSVVTERGFRAAWLLPFGIYFVGVNATLEELFWRGVVLNELRGTGDAIWTLGAIWTAFTFAAWHYLVLRLLLRPGWAEVTVLGVLGAGIFFAWLYRRTHSIIVPILWHGLLFDFVLVVVFGAVLHG